MPCIAACDETKYKCCVKPMFKVSPEHSVRIQLSSVQL